MRIISGDYKGKKIVFILTGNGLKDPEVAQKYLSSDIVKTTSRVEDISNAIISGKSKSFFSKFF